MTTFSLPLGPVVQRQLPQRGWASTPYVRQGSLLVGAQQPTATTIGQADVAFARFYGARARLNLTAGQPLARPSASFDDAVRAALVMSAGNRPAVAIVKEGAEFVLRNLLMSDTRSPYSQLEGRARAMSFADAPGDVHRLVGAIKFIRSSLMAVVDENVVLRPDIYPA